MQKQIFSSIKSTRSNFQQISRETKSGKVVKFGVDNDFPNHLISLYNNSAIHSTAVNSIVDAIIGEGLTANVEAVLDRANSEGETWNDIYTKVSKDFKLFGSFALEVIWGQTGTKIVDVYHIDMSYVRASECNYRGKIEGYYIAEDWKKSNLKDVPYLPVFNTGKSQEQPNQILVYSPYAPGKKYYSFPDYIGALNVIDLDRKIDEFHITYISNGAVPSLAITTFTGAEEDERQEIERQLRAQYAGEEGAGQIFYMDVADPAKAPRIEPIQASSGDQYYVDLSTSTTQKILTAHRITSPLLLGIQQPGSLGNRSELVDSWLLFYNKVVKPYQQQILRQFEIIFDVNYDEKITLGVQIVNMFDDGTQEAEVITSAEATTIEDAKLNDKVNEDAGL
jgi:hypothetical protein